VREHSRKPDEIYDQIEALWPGPYLELFARYFVDLTPNVALVCAQAADREGNLYTGPNTEDTPTLVEATAGNTGVGLAMVAAVKGYRCIFVLPDKMSAEKIRLLKAYGAEVVITPTAVAPDSPDSYNGVADRLTREIPGAWRPNQFANLANPEVHYRTTGPEIWEQTEGRITHFVAGVGTGGTVSGTGRYLKEVSSGRVRVIGADPDGSGLTGLRERAEALGGTLNLTSPPGRGTSVDVRLPAAAR
jgi:cystathionine beta-synthase